MASRRSDQTDASHAREVAALRREWNACQERINAFRWLWRETADWPERYNRPGDDRGLRAEVLVDPVIHDQREETLATRDALRERAASLGVVLTDIGPDPKQDARRAARMPEWSGLVEFERRPSGQYEAVPVWQAVS